MVNMLNENTKKDIINALKPLDPEKVILFGSHARGNPNEDSDIDLYVVTKDEFIPQNFDEKIKLKLKVAYAIDPIRVFFPVDLIVHTRPMAESFIRLNSSFYRDIMSHGVQLI